MKGFFASSEVQKDRPDIGLVAKCGACGLFKTCQSPKMEVYGQGAMGIMVVGEAPGATEDEQGRPFVGKAGQKLREVLRTFGVNLDKDCWTTNALICRPPENATPDDKQISYCHPNLVKAIALYQPRIIITLGRVPLDSVLKPYWKGDTGTMERWVGWQIPIDRHWICPTYHPSFVLRMDNRLIEKQFAEHLAAAFSIGSAPEPQPDYKKEIEILYGEREVEERLSDFDRAGGWAAVDYETNCLKPEYPKARALCFSVAHARGTISFSWRGANVDSVSRFLRSKGTRKIASNLKMEDRWTRFLLGHGVCNWGWDTMLAAHCLDNRQAICSLKFQAFVKLGVPSYNANIEPYLESIGDSHYNRCEEIALDTLMFYNGMDSLLELKLAFVQMIEMGYVLHD
jgi:uracil-DNA glycosylase family 4